jgi:4-amino-4-deoxy-L-arabinose transferase-like glycosyltransferase
MWRRLVRPHPLYLILLLAAAVRIWGVGFGLPHLYARPDEDALLSIAFRFFSRSLNPHWFRYPTLQMYVLCALLILYLNAGRLFGFFTSEWRFTLYAQADPSTFLLISRSIAVAAGTATVGVVYGIGRRLFGSTTHGLIGAFFLALALLHVRDSHFGVTDVPATFLLSLSFLYLVRTWDRFDRRSFLLGAVFAGLAASTKYNAALITIPALVLVLVRRDEQALLQRARDLALYAAVFVVAFLFGTPFAALDFPKFLEDVLAESEHLRTGHGLLLAGWREHLAVSLRHGLGLPLLVTGVAGLATLCAVDRRKAIFVASFPLAYFALIGSGQTSFVRYAVPLIPFLCLTAGWLVTTVAEAIGGRRADLIAWILAVLVIAPSATGVVRMDLLLARADSRVIAAGWLERNAPQGGTLHQAGRIYTHLQVSAAVRQRFEEWDFDAERGRCTRAGQLVAGLPRFIVVPSSPLALYTAISPALADLVATRYTRIHTERADDPATRPRVYDEQDAFFLPLSGFSGIDRPGPNIEIYRLK